MKRDVKRDDLSPKALALLVVIADNPPARSGEIARRFWPADTRGWDRSHKLGRGNARGAGMAPAMGGWLANLRRQGWVDVWYPLGPPFGRRMRQPLWVISDRAAAVLGRGQTWPPSATPIAREG